MYKYIINLNVCFLFILAITDDRSDERHPKPPPPTVDTRPQPPLMKHSAQPCRNDRPATGRPSIMSPAHTVRLATVLLLLLATGSRSSTAAAKVPANAAHRTAAAAAAAAASVAAAAAANAAANGVPHVEQRFAMEPQDQTAIVGSRVTLPCRVIGKNGMLQWTKDDFGLGTHRNLSGFERYSMVGSDEEGDFSLDIYPVMLDDDARYQCQVGPSPTGTPGIRSRFATLTILVPPEQPRIVQGDYLLTTEDREIELECTSVGGKPAAEVG